jgi:hypothetical protein
MGCDIHVHTEVKINGQWHHWGQPSVSRFYALFEKMAGVRGDEENAIAPLRGLPEDATFETKFDNEHWGADGHSHSWLTGEEADQLGEWYMAETKEHATCGKFIESEFGYLFGNGWNVKRYPDDYPKGVEDARWVFWFDN